MSPLLAARHAMATRFELVLYGDDAVRLRALAEEALDEINRIENLLSLYRPISDIARVNALAAASSVRIMPETFWLLERARFLSELTDGAFDITVAPLIKAWGFMEGDGKVPDSLALTNARAVVGWDKVELEPQDFSVRFQKCGVMLDLGAIGKGYALDCAATVLRDGKVSSALLHGGTSTVVAIGNPPLKKGWKVALPLQSDGSDTDSREITLKDESLSVSAPQGKHFLDTNGIMRGHVLDPRLGEPVVERIFAAVALVSATDSDALSTALLVGGASTQDKIRSLFPTARFWLR